MKKINNSFRRAASVLMAFAVIAGLLTACGGEKEEEGAGLSEYVYVPAYTSIPDEVTDISNPYLYGDTIFFSANMPVHADGTLATQDEVDAMYANYDEYSARASGADIEVSEDGEMDTAEAETEPVDETDTASDITYQNMLFSIKKDGSDYHALEDYTPKTTDSDDNYTYARFDKLIVDEQGNLWVAESITKQIFNLPEGFDESTQDPWEYYQKDETQSFIRKLSNTGAEIGSIDLSQFVDAPEETEDGYYNSFYLNDMTADKDGNIYISDGNSTVYVLGPDATFLFKKSVDNWINSLIRIKDGTVGIATNSQEAGDDSYNMVLKMLDPATKDWGKEYTVPSDVWNTSDGGSKYDFCYTDSSSLFGYDLATNTSEKILTWLNCDVDNNNISFSTVQDDGNVFAMSQDYSDEGGVSYDIITLTKTPRSEVKEKTTLTMATMWMNYNLRKQLLKFNKTNPDYRIEIVDYSEYNTDDDYNAGITKLNTEIISGNIPDLIDISNLPYKQYAAKGLLEDLYPYIDNDPDLGRDALMPGILKAAETEGKLYVLASGFSVITMIGAPSVVGDEAGWTMDDMQAVLDAHPEADYPFGMYITRETILQAMCMLNMDDFINWQTGECSFDSDEFKKLLVFANSFPDQDVNDIQQDDYIDEGTLIQDGRQLFDFFSASDFETYQYYKAMFGGAIAFKGFPTKSGSGNVAQFNGGLAMTTSCKDKDAAWQFMSSLLSDDFQDSLSWGFPMTQKAFDAKLAESMKQEYTTDENGNQVPVSHGGMSMGNNGMTVDFYAITQEEADQIEALINSADRTIDYDQDILDMIDEDANSYFSGEKTADQAADIIQSRMSIYINEQR